MSRAMLNEGELWKEQLKVVVKLNTDECNTIAAVQESMTHIGERIKKGYAIVDQYIENDCNIYILESTK